MGNTHQRRTLLTPELLASLSPLDLAAGEVRGGRLGGSRQAAVRGSSMEWMDYKEYTPGDDLRRMDWGLAGRLDRYYIRQFADERQLQSNIYLDGSASMDWGDEGSKGTMALGLAAALGYISISHMDRVSFRLLRDKECHEFCRPFLDKDLFFRVATELASMTFSGTVDLARAIESDPFPAPDSGLSILISDLLTESDWQQAVRMLLSRGRRVCVLQVLSPEEKEPLYGGHLQLIDRERASAAEDRRLILEVDRSMLEAYRSACESWLKENHRFCQKYGVPYLSISSDERLEDVLLKRCTAAGVLCE